MGKKVAFLGLGTMGGAMAANLLGAGHQVSVWNRSPDKAASLAEQGATVASTPAATAQGADAIFSMVADDGAAASCYSVNHGAGRMLGRKAAARTSNSR